MLIKSMNWVHICLDKIIYVEAPSVLFSEMLTTLRFVLCVQEMILDQHLYSLLHRICFSSFKVLFLCYSNENLKEFITTEILLDTNSFFVFDVACHWGPANINGLGCKIIIKQIERLAELRKVHPADLTECGVTDDVKPVIEQKLNIITENIYHSLVLVRILDNSMYLGHLQIFVDKGIIVWLMPISEHWSIFDEFSFNLVLANLFKFDIDVVFARLSFHQKGIHTFFLLFVWHFICIVKNTSIMCTRG